MKKSVALLLFFAITSLCLMGQFFPLTAKASNAIVIYQNDFEDEDSLNEWSVFNNSLPLSISDNESCSGNYSMILSTHENTWESPAINLYDRIKAEGAGTYHFSISVMYWGDNIGTNKSFMLLRGLSSEDANSFLTLDSSGHYFKRISEAQYFEEGYWRTFTASVKVLESDIINDTGNIIFCLDGLPIGENIELYFDDIKITKMSDTGITNGNFNEGITGWRSWNEPESEDRITIIESVTILPFANYVRANTYGSIACNVDQIFSYYGSGTYTLSFKIKAEALSNPNLPFKFYLSTNFSEHHILLGQQIIAPTDGWDFFAWTYITLPIYISPTEFSTQLKPDEKEVHFRIQAPGSGFADYSIDDVTLVPQELDEMSFSYSKSDDPQIESVTNPQILAMGKDTSLSFNYIYTFPVGTPVRCTYTSSDPSIATVDKNGTITAHHYGHTTITITSRANTSISFSFTLRVVSMYKNVGNFTPYSQEMRGLCWLACAKMIAKQYADTNNLLFQDKTLAEVFLEIRPHLSEVEGIVDPNNTSAAIREQRLGNYVDVGLALNRFISNQNLSMWSSESLDVENILTNIYHGYPVILNTQKYVDGVKTNTRHSVIAYAYSYDINCTEYITYYDPNKNIHVTERYEDLITVVNLPNIQGDEDWLLTDISYMRH